MTRQTSASVAQEEIAHFSASAGDWWQNSDTGSFQQLHRINPLRLAYIEKQIVQHMSPKNSKRILAGKTLLDVGCGGGLLTESLARWGAKVTGIDASSETIAVAQAHAQQEGLKIAYQVNSAEALAQTGEQFDCITALEIVEHVADVKSFLRALHLLLKPNGLLFMATINRTTKSYLLSIVMAEYVLRWVGVGTHDWDRFVRPSELVQGLEEQGLATTNLTGIVYNPLRRAFELRAHELDVNYLLTAKKA